MTKTETQHTPGPWEAMDSGLIYAPATDDGEAVLVCDVGEIDPSTPDRAANALLIAAAPEMWAALRQAVAALNSAPRFKVPGLENDSYKIAALCAAVLAKTKG